MPPLPFVEAILLSDNALNSDGKNSLIGIFDRITCPTFPLVYPNLFIFVRLADGQGEYSVKIQYVDAGQNRVLGETVLPQPIIWPDNVAGLDFRIQQVSLPIPHAGRFEFRLFLNDRFIGMAHFLAQPLEKQQQ